MENDIGQSPASSYTGKLDRPGSVSTFFCVLQRDTICPKRAEYGFPKTDLDLSAKHILELWFFYPTTAEL